ncbi:hypothetical protein EBZ38_17545, partial [bacterium]|nr:hypothetical protein [bacterium]
EENSTITGYVKTSADRNSWVLKAPNTAGTVTLTPGIAGITLNESTSDLLRIDGTRAMTGDLNLSFNNINSVATVFTNNVQSIVNTLLLDGGGNGVRIYNSAPIADFDQYFNPNKIVFYKELEFSTPLKITNLANGTAANDAVNFSQLSAVSNNLTQQNLATKEPTGFVDRTQSTISFNNGTRTFSIAPVSGSYDIYIKGTKYTKTTTESVTINPDATGEYYIYFDATGTLTYTNVFTPLIITDYCYVSIVYWDSAAGNRTYFAEERHGLTMDGATHVYLHTVLGARFISGFALQGFSVDGTGNLPANAQFTSDSGSMRDEDIFLQRPAQAQIPILYRIGTTWKKKAADAY